MGTRLPSIKNVFKTILKEFDLKQQVGTPAYIFLVQKYKNNEASIILYLLNLTHMVSKQYYNF